MRYWRSSTWPSGEARHRAVHRRTAGRGLRPACCQRDYRTLISGSTTSPTDEKAPTSKAAACSFSRGHEQRMPGGGIFTPWPAKR